MAKRAVVSDMCPSCLTPWSGHTIRERRRCVPVELPDEVPGLAAVDPPSSDVTREPGTRCDEEPPRHEMEVVASPKREGEPRKGRRFDIPEDIRQKTRQVRRLRRERKEVPAELLAAEREYQRLRWSQLTAEERARATRQSNGSRSTQGRSGSHAPRVHLRDPRDPYRSRCGLASADAEFVDDNLGTLTCGRCASIAELEAAGPRLTGVEQSKAYGLAQRRLREAHPDEFMVLLDEARADLLAARDHDPGG